MELSSRLTGRACQRCRWRRRRKKRRKKRRGKCGWGWREKVARQDPEKGA